MRRAGPEHPLEKRARIHLGRERRGGRAPGEVVLIDAGVVGVAGADVEHGVAGKFERTKRREQADLLRHDLVDGNAGMKIRAVGFLDAHAGEERGVGAGMVAAAIRSAIGGNVGETAEHLDVCPSLWRAAPSCD